MEGDVSGACLFAGLGGLGALIEAARDRGRAERTAAGPPLGVGSDPSPI